MNWVERSEAAKVGDINWLANANAVGVTGFMHPVELEKLVKLAEGRDVLEIGSYKGLSAWCMAQSARTLTCVDTFKAWSNGQTQAEELTTYEDFLAATRGFPNVKSVIATSEEAWRILGRKRYDMIFLDANHTYEDTRRDIRMWWGRLKPGGVFCLHDYGHDDYPGVKQACDERFGDLGLYAPETQNWVVTLRWEWK